MTYRTVDLAITLLSAETRPGSSFLDAAVKALAVGSQCRNAGIAMLSPDGKSIELAAHTVNGADQALTQFAVEESACADLYQPDADSHHETCGDVAKRFPGDPTIGGDDTAFYYAQVFHEIAGEVVGVGDAASGSATVGDRRVVYPWIGCGTCETCTSGGEQFCRWPRNLGVNVDGGYSDHVIVPHPRYLVPFDPMPVAEA